jgi:two-component system, OmpR family, sensor histidine kinase KdpD
MGPRCHDRADSALEGLEGQSRAKEDDGPLMNEDLRPDPDALVERIRQDEQKAAHGRLRIYFGASAGVGKTYAMLVGARALKATGIDVVAGVIETHGRTDTAAQTAGLEVLPRRVITGAGQPAVAEFDLDAALVRRPALILVDELAHTNVVGSRHPKRWQDVDELLAAGIDVWTTLNVQHLESLNDVVGGITGIRVQETLPDTFFDRADEIVLVDTPADELLARLKAGKVYGEVQAERAAANFFRKGNLMALRELALRRTADRVETDVQTYRSDRSIGRVWKTESAILCCIGPNVSAEHVVRGAALLAQQLAVSWHAVYVETPALQRLPEARRQRILANLKLAEELGATTAILPSGEVAAAVVEYARANNLSRMVMGHNQASLWRPAGTLAQQLGKLAADVDLIELGSPASARGRPASAPDQGEDTEPALKLNPVGYLVAALACAVLTALVLPLEGVLDKANIVMLYLLAVVGVSLRYGRGPAIVSALVNVLAFDYFLVPPTLSFVVADLQYLLTFGVMLAVGLIVGQLTAGLRYQVRVAMHRERRSHSLFEVARDLSGELVVDQVIETAAKAIGREFHSEVRILVLGLDDRLTLTGAQSEPPGMDVGTARWAFDHRQAAGLGTDTIPGSAWHYLPLNASMRTRGVLALQPESPRLLTVPEQRRQLETFAALTAIALERVHYVDVAQRATVQIESERLRNSLLSALSHDLRTPLAGLTGLAESLQLSRPALSEAQGELAEELVASAMRMSTQVNNLLDMARIESGEFRLSSDWNSIEELIGSAVRVSRRVLAGRTLETDVPPGLPLVRCDAVLIERVIVNLLENAAKYTPPDARVQVIARQAGDELRVTVVDNGPGLRPGSEREIFNKFSRGVRESAIGGVGLGLAICKAIIEAHGGSISAMNQPEHGAAFIFTLPVSKEQPTPSGEWDLGTTE